MTLPLFDAQLDLTLLSLSLLDPHTHRFLVATNLLHPPTPPPCIHSPTRCLFVPHLRLPWSSTLCTQLWRYLQIRLIPLDSSPLLAVEHFLGDISQIDSKPFQNRTQTFYPTLPRRHDEANRMVLTKIARTNPNALSHIATCVKLAYANALCHSLTERTMRTSHTLQRLLRPPTTTKTRTHPSSHKPSVTPTTSLTTTTMTTTTTSSSSPTRPGAAETGRLPPPRARTTPASSTSPQSSLPPPPKPLSRLSNVSIIAHELPRTRGAPARCLLHGVAVSSILLPAIASCLSEYGIIVLTRAPTPPPASLLNLSNRGIQASRLATPTPTAGRPPAHARGPVALDDAVDAHVQTWLSMSWRELISRVVCRAKGVVREREIGECVENREMLQRAMRKMEVVRRGLIDSALQQELQGASLADMCAFTIAKWRRKEFESKVGNVAEQYERHVHRAEERLGLLNSVELRNAGRLLAPAVLGR